MLVIDQGTVLDRIDFNIEQAADLISPHTSPYLPISPHISPYLPVSPHVLSRRRTSYLPISPHISPYLPISPHISPYLEQAADRVQNAVVELNKANEYQKKSKTMMCIYLLLLLCGAPPPRRRLRRPPLPARAA